MKRTKRTNTEVMKSRGEFEEAIDTIAQLQLDLAGMIVARDKEREDVLARHGARIKSMELEIKTLQTAAQAYASVNWEALAKPCARTADTVFAHYGFRTGNPALKAIGKRRLADIAEELHEAGHDAYVKAETKISLNRPAIIKAVSKGVAVVSRLFKVDQAERFFVEAKAQQD